MNFTVNENSGPPKIVHLPFGPRLEKGCRPLVYILPQLISKIYQTCDVLLLRLEVFQNKDFVNLF